MPTIDLVRPVNSRVDPHTAPASTAFSTNTLVAPNEDNSSNTFVAAAAGSAAILGVIKKAIATTDSDYASEKLVGILVDEDADWEFTVGTGTADANDEQGFIDLKDADEVDVTASARDAIFVTKFIKGTVVRGKIALWAHRQPPIVR